MANITIRSCSFSFVSALTVKFVLFILAIIGKVIINIGRYLFAIPIFATCSTAPLILVVVLGDGNSFPIGFVIQEWTAYRTR